MIVVQRKSDGKYLKARAHKLELWCKNTGDAKQYVSEGRALMGMIEARIWAYSNYGDCSDREGYDRKAIADDIKQHHNFWRLPL